jgi:hypothetical protein
MNRNDNWLETAAISAENISYGMTNGLDVVIQLLVDAGVPEKAHRT